MRFCHKIWEIFIHRVKMLGMYKLMVTLILQKKTRLKTLQSKQPDLMLILMLNSTTKRTREIEKHDIDD